MRDVDAVLAEAAAWTWWKHAVWNAAHAVPSVCEDMGLADCEVPTRMRPILSYRSALVCAGRGEELRCTP